MHTDTLEDPVITTLELAPLTVPTAARCTVVQRLRGGIGNQLFQVLYAQRVAAATASQLAFDLQAYQRDGYQRRPVLQRLWPNSPQITTLPTETTRALREADMAWPAEGPLPERFALPAGLTHLLLEGYWQDHRVLSRGALADLRQRLVAAVAPNVQALAGRIKSTARPTALHVRRHDYKHHGLASDNFYIDALRWLTARSGPLDVFVFSDEPNSTALFLAQAGIRAQIVASGDDLDDLFLMSQCSRHIISNSTYSWWGAMLSGSADVVWPDPWSLAHTPSPQLCPPHWRRVKGAVERPVAQPRFTGALDDEQFRIDRDAFFAQAPLPEGWQVQMRPCLGDATATTAFDAHYVYHTAWAARRLHQHPAPLHTDIGSDLRFATLASAFQRLRFLDFRPAQVTLSNLECGPANLLQLDMADQSLPSLSCMHVVEHIGLGRYGDPINFHGAEIAMQQLQRVLAPGGLLYFVVPVGQPTIVFHAHRIFRASDIVAAFAELELLEFSLILDHGDFVEHVPLQAADSQRYGCGCFLFRRAG